MNAIVPAGGSGMIPTDMAAAMRLAEMMSTGRLVPQHLQKSPGDCLMVVELAMRFRMSPFAVAQCTSVIQGKLMLEGKLVAAAINSSGVLEDRLSYEFAGANETRSVTVRGTMRGETSPREMKVMLAEAQTTNPLWKKQPDQQLVYFGTRAWARRHAPEVMLGVYSPEEFDAQTARDTFRGTTLDAEAQPTPAPEPAVEAVRPKPKQTPDEYLDALAAELAAATTAEVDEILARPSVQAAQDRARGAHKDRLQHILDEAIARTAADEVEAGDGLYANPSDDPFRQPVTA
jgi:RecT family